MIRVDAFECPARRQQAHDLRRLRLTGAPPRSYRLYCDAGALRPPVVLWDELPLTPPLTYRLMIEPVKETHR